MTAVRVLGTSMFDNEDITDPDINTSDTEASRLIEMALSKLDEGAVAARKARTAANRLRNVCTPSADKA